MNQSLSLIFAFQKDQACGTVHAETRGYMSSKQVSGQEKKRDRLRETQLLLLERGWHKNVWLWEDPGKPLKHSKKNNKVPYPWIQFWEPLPAQKVVVRKGKETDRVRFSVHSGADIWYLCPV